MSTRNPGLTKSYDVGAAVGAYKIVKYGSSDGVLVQSAAGTDLHIGISSEIATEVGERCDVFREGIAPVIYGGNVTRGQLVTADSEGRAVTASDGDWAIGQAEVSGVLGDRGSVHINPTRINFADNVTATTDEIDTLAGKVAGVTYTIGTEATNAITVTMQLTDAAGADLAEVASVFAYLSSNADGSTFVGTAPSGGVAIATDGLAIPLVAGRAWQFVSEADGDIAVTITEAGVATYYLVCVLPNGALDISGAITFA